MRKLILFLLPTLALCGQTAGLGPACPSNVRAGQPLVCTIQLSASGGAIAALQWTLTVSAPSGTQAVVASGTAVAAQKTSVCNASGTCLLWGFNGNTIADGTVARVTIPIPMALGGQTFTLTASGTVGASPAGASVAVSGNPPVSVSVLSGCDIDGNGLTNGADATAESDNVLVTPQPSGTDLNNDGAGNIVDVQIVVNAARGLACTAQ